MKGRMEGNILGAVHLGASFALILDNSGSDWLMRRHLDCNNVLANKQNIYKLYIKLYSCI